MRDKARIAWSKSTGAFEWPGLVAALIIAFLAVVVYKVLFE